MVGARSGACARGGSPGCTPSAPRRPRAEGAPRSGSPCPALPCPPSCSRLCRASTRSGSAPFGCRQPRLGDAVVGWGQGSPLTGPPGPPCNVSRKWSLVFQVLHCRGRMGALQGKGGDSVHRRRGGPSLSFSWMAEWSLPIQRQCTLLPGVGAPLLWRLLPH